MVQQGESTMYKARYHETDILLFGTRWTGILSSKTFKMNGFNEDSQSCIIQDIFEKILYN